MTKPKQKPPEKMTKAELIKRVRHLEDRDAMWARQLASLWDTYRWIARRRHELEAQLTAIRRQVGVSGPDARTFHVDWAVQLMGQCEHAGVPFFLKQMGDHVIGVSGERIRLGKKGGDWNEWPEALRIREFPITEVAR